MPARRQSTIVDPLDTDVAQRLDEHGFLVLRKAIPADWLPSLRNAFEKGELAADKWPVPRGADWRHALLDLDPTVQQVCRLPVILAAVGHLLRGPFHLSQVEGREPRHGGGAQILHSDGPDCSEIQTVSVLAFLDDFGSHNGATRVVPGTHRSGTATPGESLAIGVSGCAGDLLLFGSTLLHGATCNESGAPRRTLLMNFAVEALRATYEKTRVMRAVQMCTDEVFDLPTRTRTPRQDDALHEDTSPT